jgi:hypothetical protein
MSREERVAAARKDVTEALRAHEVAHAAADAVMRAKYGEVSNTSQEWLDLTAPTRVALESALAALAVAQEA